MFDVVIVGAGPAGLFTAYELLEKNKKLKVAILDRGFKADKRVCPMNRDKSECKDLTKYMGQKEAYDLIDDTEKIFNKFNMDSKVYPTNMDEAEEIKKKISKVGASLLIIKQKHLGSDKLPGYIQGISDYLEKEGVTLFEKSDVLDISKENKEYKVTYKKGKEEKEILAKYVVVAPGRTGAKWIQELADKYKIPYVSQSIEIGVRVETRKEILSEITDVIYDPTIFIKTKTYGDEIRTFCTNPGGFVAKENYEGYICVNGHSLKDIKSDNSNFAFISKVTLTHPTTNTRLYGESIARIANVLGSGKPIIQSLKDLKQGRRSEWHRINKGFVEPTLKDCVAGDLSLVLPHRIILNILEGLETLDKIIPGVNNDETLLYGPEIKFFSNEITTDNNMKIENEDIYFVGDGAGKAGNIVAAAATGLVAARDIIKRVK